jgi:predicted AlkP superfamily pyrophosphatase or phosphodiesterase
VKNAVLGVDKEIGDLVNGVKAAGLEDRVHYVVVSDHGMAALSADRMIVVDDYIDIEQMDVVDWTPLLALTPKDGDVEKAYAALRGKHPALDVYRSN